MNQKLWEIVENLRKDGVPISDEEAEEVFNFCNRKMEVSEIRNREDYLPLLYGDEMLNYCIRRAVNATTMLMQIRKEGLVNV